MITSQKQITDYELEITQDCNAECPLCERTIQNMPLRGNPTMTLEDVKLIFPNKELMHGTDIGLCGTRGDPILNPQCFEICEYLKHADDVCLSTNGGYNNVEWWERLATLDNVTVDFCLDGHEDTNHLYRVNVNWNTAIRNLEAYVAAGGHAKWVFIAFEHNEIDYEKCKEHATKLGIRFQVKSSGRNYKMKKFKQNVHKPRKHDSFVTLNTSQKYTNKNETEVNKASMAYYKPNLEKQKEFAKTISCRHFESKHLYISANMDVSPCCYLNYPTNRLQMMRHYSQDLRFANLRNNTMQEILDKFNEIDIKSRWDPENPGHIIKCVKQCGNNAAAKDTRKYIT